MALEGVLRTTWLLGLVSVSRPGLSSGPAVHRAALFPGNLSSLPLLSCWYTMAVIPLRTSSEAGRQACGQAPGLPLSSRSWEKGVHQPSM